MGFRYLNPVGGVVFCVRVCWASLIRPKRVEKSRILRNIFFVRCGLNKHGRDWPSAKWGYQDQQPDRAAVWVWCWRVSCASSGPRKSVRTPARWRWRGHRRTRWRSTPQRLDWRWSRGTRHELLWRRADSAWIFPTALFLPSLCKFSIQSLTFLTNV